MGSTQRAANTPNTPLGSDQAPPTPTSLHTDADPESLTNEPVQLHSLCQ